MKVLGGGKRNKVGVGAEQMCGAQHVRACVEAEQMLCGAQHVRSCVGAEQMCGAQHVPVLWWYLTSRASVHCPGHLLRWVVIASQKFQPVFKSELFGSSAMGAMLVSEAVTT